MTVIFGTVLDSWFLGLEASYTFNKQLNKQTNKQTNIRRDGLTDRQTNELTNKQLHTVFCETTDKTLARLVNLLTTAVFTGM